MWICPSHSLKAQRESTDTVPRSLYFDGRLRVTSLRPRPLYPWEINPVPIVVETVWASEPVWAFLGMRRFLSTTTRNPVHPDRKLRRLMSYDTPGSKVTKYEHIFYEVM